MSEEQTTGRRSRRSKAKVVDYSKEQEFSDEDLFEDVSQNEPAPVTPAVTKKRKTKGNRKSKGGNRKSSSKKQKQQDADTTSTDPFEDDTIDEYVPSKPIYTEKGYDPALPPIRERFPFLPEFELDGSPRIELIVGRRPVDEKDKSRKENSSDDDGDGDKSSISDDDGDDDDDEEESDGRKRRGRLGNDKGNNKRGKKSSAGNNKKKKEDSGKDFVEYEYLVKYKNLSYMHLEWKSGADLESMNKSAKTIYRRYLKKVTQGQDEELENPEFDPSYVVVQRVLAEEEQELELEVQGEELLKWEEQRERQLASEDLSEEEREKEEERQKEEEEKQKKEEETKLEKEKETEKAAEEKPEEGADKKDGEIAQQEDGDGENKSILEEEKKGMC